MGHDIYADYDADNGAYVAYLRFNFSDYRAQIFYEVLGISDIDGGVSGIGGTRIVTYDRFIEARDSTLIDEYIRKFIQKCIDYMLMNNLKEIGIYAG